MAMVVAGLQWIAGWAWGWPIPLKAAVTFGIAALSWFLIQLDGTKVYGDDRPDPLPYAPAPAATIKPTLPGLDGAEARALAQRFQPSVHLDFDDGFPPVAVEAPFAMRARSGRRGVCLSRVGGGFETLGDACTILTRASELAEHQVPDANWAVDFAPGGLSELREALTGLARLAQGGLAARVLGPQAPMYFHVVPGPNGTIGIQYWFFYPFNYQPLIGSLSDRSSGLFQIPLNPAGRHEGDFESIAVLLSADLRPVYVWMARHDEEGHRFAWEEGVLDRPSLEDSHLDVYAARGSHATYEFCSRKAREENKRTPDDVCRDHLKITPLRAGEAPLVDLARTSWACWRGRFGWSPHKPWLLKHVDGDGPLMPLWQQHKFGDGATPCSRVRPLAQRDRDAAQMPDGRRARTLRARSGRVNGVFARCADWDQPARAGAYIVACSDRLLTRFVRSGLSESGGPCVRFVTPHDKGCRTPAIVPAVYHASNPSQLDRLLLTADSLASVDVYVASRGQGRTERVAFFEDVALSPARRLRAEYTDDGWRLVDRGRVFARPVEEDSFTRHRPPGEPSHVQAVRTGHAVKISFSGEGSRRLRYAVALAGDRAALSDDPLVVRTIRPGAATGHAEAPDGDGRTRYTVTLRAAEATAVRVSAHRDGMAKAAADATVSSSAW